MQGLVYARQMPEPGHRSGALAASAPHLTEPLRGQVLAQALEATRTIGDEGDRKSVV